MLFGIQGTKMDKADFIKLAPRYYALAIGLRFSKNGGPQTRQSIMNDYMVHEEGGTSEDVYCLVDDFTIWNRAIDWLVESDMISAFTDPFGPPVYMPRLCETVCERAIGFPYPYRADPPWVSFRNLRQTAWDRLFPTGE